MRGGAQIRKNLQISASVAVGVAFIDQITKAAVVHRLYLTESIEVIRGLFNIVHYRNPGAAFSILASGGTLCTVFLIGTSLAALIVIGFLARRSTGLLQTIALGLIAGGAIGNLIDRMRFGYVVDFLDFHVGAYHWPAFNAADSAITMGVVLAAIAFYSPRKKD